MEKAPVVLTLVIPLLLLLLSPLSGLASAQNSPVKIDVGLVLNLQSSGGNGSRTSISMAIEDFYAANPNSSTRVILHARDSEGDNVGAASAAIDLIKDAQVQAIIGSMTSAQAEFVTDLGNKAHVPILSFSVSSPFLSPLRTPYFIRTTLNDSSQAIAIAATVKSFGWPDIVPVYEDTEYGTGIVPALTDAFQSVGVRIPYRLMLPCSPSDDQIAAGLRRLAGMPTRVFVVHMLADFGARLFVKAAEAGMMSSGYVWIVTDGMANDLQYLDSHVINAMKGVLGVRPYVPKTTELESFTRRWTRRFLAENPAVQSATPSIYHLWAYDTAWAMAKAAERASPPSHDHDHNSTDLGLMGISSSRAGRALLESIWGTRFRGVAGEFRLVDGQLQSPGYEVLNMGGDQSPEGRLVGYWNPADQEKISWLPRPSTVVWPGDSAVGPKGWQIPAIAGKKLRVGVPVKDGFNEFVNLECDARNGTITASGFTIDVFDAVMRALPYTVLYEYVPFGNACDHRMAGSYDELVYQVFLGKYDAVVGDVTIISNRSNYVDFSQPYTESGVTMIVPVKRVGNGGKAWVFLKPLTADLWLGSFAFFFFTGFVVWVLEHRVNEEFRGPPLNQLGLIFYFAFSTLVFAHRERVVSNPARFVVAVWVFVVLVLTSSYTASLSSLLTVRQLQPEVVAVDDLLRNGDYVGYQKGSSVPAVLRRMKFDEDKLVSLSSPEQYVEALARGSKNGGVAAIFDDVAYLQSVAANHCGDYELVGWTYQTDGYGFAFPRGSPLVSDVSSALLTVMDGDLFSTIVHKWFGNSSTCDTTETESFRSINSTLNSESFKGLFLITGAVSLLSVILFFAKFLYKEKKELKMTAKEPSILKRLATMASHYDSKDLTCHTFKKKRAVILDAMDSNRDDSANTTPNDYAGSQSPFTFSCVSTSEFGPPEEALTSTTVELASPCMEGPLVAENALEMVESREEITDEQHMLSLETTASEIELVSQVTVLDPQGNK